MKEAGSTSHGELHQFSEPNLADGAAQSPLVRIVDDDESVREGLRYMLAAEGLEARGFSNAEDFLANERPDRPGCIILDVRMPGASGNALHAALKRLSYPHPVIFLSGHGTIDMAVSEVKRGAYDFLEKPIDPVRFLAVVRGALNEDRRRQKKEASAEVRKSVRLTKRETQVVDLALIGRTSTEIADLLGLSVRTVENYRAAAYRKFGVSSLEGLQKARHEQEE